MSVYFVRSGDFVKIGFARNPIDRIKSMQTASPNKLEILAIINGFEGRERELHKRFKADLYRGEWFWCSDAILDYIRECQLNPVGSAGPDTATVKRGFWMEFKQTGKKWLARFRWRNPDGTKSSPVRAKTVPPMNKAELSLFKEKRAKLRAALDSPDKRLDPHRISDLPK